MRHKLNKTKYSVRASQAVLQYGVGAMVEFEDQTLMTADSKYWASENKKKIRDERLEKLHEVNFFYTPCVKNGNGKDEGYGIAYVRFPEWYFCPNCRKFKRIEDWIKYNLNESHNSKMFEEDQSMIKTIKCGDCNCDLVVARVVTACKNGHIDDFPWVEWAHCQNSKGAKEICSNPDLEYSIAKTASAGLDSVIVKCKTCKCSASLKKAFDFGGKSNNVFQKIDHDTGYKYKLRCSGKHPWKHSYERCDCYPKAMQRGASSIYFPVTDSSLIIPPYSSLIRKKVLESEAYDAFATAIANIMNMDFPDENLKKQFIDTNLKGLPQKYCDSIHDETDVSIDTILKILNEKINEDGESGHSEGTTFSDNYRYEEYLALTGVEKPEDEFDDFQCEIMDINTYSDIPFISKISLINKMREVQAHIGFSRIDPTDPTESADKQPTIVSVKATLDNGISWLPACEVKGEGIFIELNEDYIQQWLNGNLSLKNKVYLLNQRYRESYLGKNNKRYITAKFLLLHTFSHLLIKKLSFECGYNISSLKERIYCSDGNADGGKMSGILIYTASGDSEGTLGGLVRQGKSDVFPGIVKKAIESSFFCSNDPVCSLSQGQGHESLNFASCYACSLLPETSCEEFNIFLDRSVLTGTIDNRKNGFFNMFTMFSDGSDKAGSKAKDESQKTADYSGIHSDGTNNIIGALEQIKADVNDEEIVSVINRIIAYSSGRTFESPIMDSNISLSDRDVWPDLMWPESKVAWFLPERADDYEELKGYDWHCYLISVDSTPEELLDKVKEG